jgi:hypothetical protein
MVETVVQVVTSKQPICCVTCKEKLNLGKSIAPGATVRKAKNMHRVSMEKAALVAPHAIPTFIQSLRQKIRVSGL